MSGEADNMSGESSWIDRLQNDVLEVPYATLEYELERSRQRLAIWDIFLAHMKAGADTWPEIRRALTEEEVDRIAAICNGIPLRDVLS